MVKIVTIFAVIAVVKAFDVSVEVDTEGGKFGGPGYEWLEVERQRHRRFEPKVKSFSVVETSHGGMGKMGKIHRAILTSVRDSEEGGHHEHLEIKHVGHSEEDDCDSREHPVPKGYFGGILAYPKALMTSVKAVHIPPPPHHPHPPPIHDHHLHYHHSPPAHGHDHHPPLPPRPPVEKYKAYVGGYYPGSVGYGHSYRFVHFKKP